MRACSAVFEPETVISSFKGTQGPLTVALQKREQMETYCTVPLVLDFMSRKFWKGLPTMTDREGLLENNKNLTDPKSVLVGACMCLAELRGMEKIPKVEAGFWKSESIVLLHVQRTGRRNVRLMVGVGEMPRNSC